MPTYEYKCIKCKETVDIVHKITEEIVYFCMDCNIAMTKMFCGTVGVHFKGNGWYETDYKNK
jgi:putative FmdB family regulatory protein